MLSVQVPALSAILGKPPACAVITRRGRYTLIRLLVAGCARYNLRYAPPRGDTSTTTTTSTSS